MPFHVRMVELKVSMEINEASKRTIDVQGEISTPYNNRKPISNFMWTKQTIRQGVLISAQIGRWALCHDRESNIQSKSTYA